MKTLALISKEFRHILRDPRSLLIVIIMPVMMLFLYGYALNLDIKNISLGVVDYDNSATSRSLLARFGNSGYFTLRSCCSSVAEVEPRFRSRELMAALVIPKGFERGLGALAPSGIEVIVDGSDSNIGTIILGYAEMIITAFNGDLNPTVHPPIQLRATVLYNEDLKSSYFFVPGLVAIILMMVSALLTSITITREKETGTMEQLLVAPISRVHLIIGKVVPYIFLALVDGILIVFFAHVWFEVPIKGSLVQLTLMSVLYIIACLALGLLISTIAKTQQIAIMLALLTTMLPSIMLSGFIFPIASMPKVLQYVTHIVPARYFVIIVRGSMLKGLQLGVFTRELCFLGGFALLLLSISVVKFSRRLG